jgi:hypothetical protein
VGALKAIWQRFLQTGFSLILVAALAGCRFEPSIPPLEVGTAPPQPFGAAVPGSAEPPAVLPETPPASPPVAGGLPRTSSEARALCGEDLLYGDSYGDEDVGYCLAPGGDTYYVWLTPDQVFEIATNEADTNQARLLRAIRARRAQLTTARQTELPLVGSILGVGGGLALAAKTCGAAILATGPWIGAVLCVVGGLGFIGAGLSTVSAADRGSTALVLVQTAEKQAAFYLCLVQGGSDRACREQTGITDEQLEETFEE